MTIFRPNGAHDWAKVRRCAIGPSACRVGRDTRLSAAMFAMHGPPTEPQRSSPPTDDESASSSRGDSFTRRKDDSHTRRWPRQWFGKAAPAAPGVVKPHALMPDAKAPSPWRRLTSDDTTPDSVTSLLDAAALRPSSWAAAAAPEAAPTAAPAASRHRRTTPIAAPAGPPAVAPAAAEPKVSPSLLSKLADLQNHHLARRERRRAGPQSQARMIPGAAQPLWAAPVEDKPAHGGSAWLEDNERTAQ